MTHNNYCLNNCFSTRLVVHTHNVPSLLFRCHVFDASERGRCQWWNLELKAVLSKAFFRERDAEPWPLSGELENA